MTRADRSARRAAVRAARGRPVCDRGATAVEMALVSPLLFLLLFGIIDFGRMLNAQITLTEAAREGARAAALGFDPVARTTDAARGLPATVSVTACPGDSDPAADAVVQVTHPFDPVTPLGPIVRWLGGQEDGSVTITATGVMPCVG